MKSCAAPLHIMPPDTHLQASRETIVRLLERHRVLDALAQSEGARGMLEHPAARSPDGNPDNL